MDLVHNLPLFREAGVEEGVEKQAAVEEYVASLDVTAEGFSSIVPVENAEGKQV